MRPSCIELVGSGRFHTNTNAELRYVGKYVRAVRLSTVCSSQRSPERFNCSGVYLENLENNIINVKLKAYNGHKIVMNRWTNGNWLPVLSAYNDEKLDLVRKGSDQQIGRINVTLGATLMLAHLVGKLAGTRKRWEFFGFLWPTEVFTDAWKTPGEAQKTCNRESRQLLAEQPNK